jgi:hypothetical protein
MSPYPALTQGRCSQGPMRQGCREAENLLPPSGRPPTNDYQYMVLITNIKNNSLENFEISTSYITQNSIESFEVDGINF